MPFRSLGIPDDNAVDGWGNLLNYAITESLTDKTTFRQTGGAIDVVDENDVSRLTPEGSTQYVIFSTGEDGAGGYASSGVPVSPCPVGLLQTENCDGDAVFRDTYEHQSHESDDRPKDNSLQSFASYDDYILYKQYDVEAAKGGSVMVYFYPLECPPGFKRIPFTPDRDVTIIGVELLNTYPPHHSAGRRVVSESEYALCESIEYSNILTFGTRNKLLQGETLCPSTWTSIGFKDIDASMGLTFEVCAK